MVVPCVAELSDPNDEAMVPRRCSARIKNLKSKQEAQRERQKARCRSIDDPALQKKTKVYKKSKAVASSQAADNDVTVATVDNNDVTVSNVAVPNDCPDHPAAEASPSPHLRGNENEKSSHARVTETILRFNKHYLHFVQEKKIRCGRAQADQKTKKNSKSKVVNYWAEKGISGFTVGTYFVGQYYQMLQTQPDFVHQFYSDASTVLRIDSSTREAASGMLQIHTLIMSLQYTGIEIKTLHSLESWNGGVLVMVSGSVHVKGRYQQE